MIAYKYVPFDCASKVEQGNLRIGTLGSFAHVEEARRDSHEGELTTPKISGTFHGLKPGTRLGHLVIGEGNKAALNLGSAVFELGMPQAYAFCMSLDITESEAKAEMQQRALFRILDVNALRRAISFRHRQLRHHWWAQPVVYGSRAILDPFDMPEVGNPFRKESKLSWEKEFRFVWRPAREPSPGEELPVIDTGPSKRIAKLLTRLR